MGFIRFTFNPEDSRRPQRLRQSPEGEWVRFDAAQAEIARLTAELERCKAGPTTRGLDMTTQINAEDFYDYVAAEKEGWFISYAPGNLDETIWRLERRDANPVFLGGDPEAHTHVVKRALEGSKLHQDALDFLRTHEPREYEIVLRHAKETPTTMKDRQRLGRVLRQPIRGEVVMQRYEDTVSRVDTGIGSFTEYRMKKSVQGSYVRYNDAQAAIARLTAERDQALARAAAAAMEMRERAAEHAWNKRDLLADAEKKQIDAGLTGRDYYGRRLEAELLSRSIRALPIDPDAQKALDKLLAKSREDAIRLSASIAESWKAFDGEDYRPVESVILALLNDGG